MLVASFLSVALLLSPTQCANLDLARRVGSEYDLEQTLPAVMYIESSAGINLVGDDGTSFGPMQMQLRTAKEILRRNPTLLDGTKRTDGGVVRRLLTDFEWALRMAAAHLRDLRRQHGYKKALRAYNAGETGMLLGRGVGYSEKVIQHLGLTCRKENDDA